MTDVARASSPPSEAYLLPIGHDLGPLDAPVGTSDAGADPPEVDPAATSGAGDGAAVATSTPLPGPRQFGVRVGDRTVRLDNAGYAVWLLTHDGEQTLPTRASVVRAASSLGLSTTLSTAAVAELLAEGLVVEIAPDSIREFAESHQLLPLMLGLGQDDSDPELRLVGLLDLPVVQVSTPLFDLWMWAHLEPNLWQSCRRAAEVAREAGATAPDEVEPDRVLAAMLSAVHPLLATRAAYLDRRVAQTSERMVAA